MSRDQGGGAAAAVLATFAVIILIAGIVVGGYLAGWWLNEDIQNRQAHLNRTTFEQQTTYRDEMVRKIGDVKAVDVQIAQNPDPDVQAQLQAQRRALVDIVCRDNTHINGGLDLATQSFVDKECR